MSEPLLGQVNLYGFHYAPKGFALCTGQLIEISENQALYSLLGTTYGGDGRTTFGCPDLRGRTPISYGTDMVQRETYTLGQSGGQESVVLTEPQLATHTHPVRCTNNPSTKVAPNTGRLLGMTFENPLYHVDSDTPASDNLVQLASSSVSSIGNGGAHNNTQPTIAVNFSICISGFYPPRN